MKIIRPLTITDGILTSSNVIETPPNFYSNVTTYALDDLVATGTVGGVLLCYQSLAGGNLNNTPSSSPTWWEYIGDTYTEWLTATPYAEGDIVLVIGTTHHVYESLVPGNVGNYPPDNTSGTAPKWLDLGASNKWYPFDKKVGSQATRPKTIIYALTPATIITGISCLNVSGVTATVTVTEPTVGTVYTEVVELIATYNVYDWSSYFFEDFFFVENFSLLDLPPYQSAVITVTIDAGTATALCGEIVLGKVFEIGQTQYNTELSIMDYSRKTVDAFGNYEILERAFSKQREYRVWVENDRLNAICQFVTTLRATPVVWIAAEDSVMAPVLVTFGFFKDFRVVIPYPTASEMSLTIEGLT